MIVIIEWSYAFISILSSNQNCFIAYFYGKFTYAGSANPFVYTIISWTSVLLSIYSTPATKSFLFTIIYTSHYSKCSHWGVIKNYWKELLIHPLSKVAIFPFVLQQINFELLHICDRLCFAISFLWKLFYLNLDIQ